MRPTSVRILGQLLVIQYVDSGPFDNDAFGRADVVKQTLSVRNGQGPHQERDTLLHELLHACGLAIGHELEEHQVASVTPILLDVLRQNPDVVAYLTEPME